MESVGESPRVRERSMGGAWAPDQAAGCAGPIEAGGFFLRVIRSYSNVLVKGWR